ncbi:hypothetical protein C8R46DRAFT_1228470 [Mycena filopes]|nr:hypothetical protein C8R46DRAFT_1228470 [Mycena filopes]
MSAPAHRSKENMQQGPALHTMPPASTKKNRHVTETLWEAQQSPLITTQPCVPVRLERASNPTERLSSEALYASLLEFKFPVKQEYKEYTPQVFGDVEPACDDGVAPRSPEPQSSEGSAEEIYQASDDGGLTGHGTPILVGYDFAGRPVWATQLYTTEPQPRPLPAPYLPCTACGFFECPNIAGEYDSCPYATVYEVGEHTQYDASAGYGYEHLPRSANPRGWTFENTGGCRLYGLGLKSLAPPESNEVVEV